MNISFDRALLWLIPYLYLVSVSYYWGFWGSFEIDVFNYYPVSDLVKGVTSPLGTTLLSTLWLMMLLLLVRFTTGKFFYRLSDFWSKMTGILFLFLMISVLSAIIYLIYFVKISPNMFVSPDTNFAVMKENLPIDTLLLVAVIIISFIVDVWMFSESEKFSFLAITKSSGIFFLLLLPCKAYVGGKEKASRILHDLVFDYTIMDSVVYPQKSIYKYLGKAGEYHIILTLDNNQRIIIPSDKMVPLIIEKFSTLDKESVVRFRKHQKILLSVSQKQIEAE